VAGIDIAMLMMAATNTCAPAHALRPQLWRRYLALMIDGLRPGPTSTLPTPPSRPAFSAPSRGASGDRAPAIDGPAPLSR